jgi:hypothetical protein
MFHMQLPLLEKILRPVIVYLALIVFLRVFGKRELAQLNPFDLVVLLSLSNTVQNAIIGDDNSVSGGIIGALSLLSINWIVVRLLYGSPKMNEALGGTERVLILDGVIGERALKKELLAEEELLAVAHRRASRASPNSPLRPRAQRHLLHRGPHAHGRGRPPARPARSPGSAYPGSAGPAHAYYRGVVVSSSR